MGINRRRRVTLSDVAQAAGVSKAAASRALSDDTYGVRPDVRERVRQVAAELNYLPNAAARGLRVRTSRLLGLVVSDIENPYYTGVARAIGDTAREHGYSLIVANTDEEPEREAEALEVMSAEQVAAVILGWSGGRVDSIQRLIEHGVPVIALGRRLPDVVVDTVAVDNEEASYRLVGHLLTLGHRRIAMIADPDVTGHERYTGYVRALRDARVTIDERLLRRGDLREAGGFEGTLSLVDTDDPPTALFTGMNLTTMGALRALRHRRVSIPSDMSVVGFDDVPLGDVIDPPLTVVAQPLRAIGTRAAGLALARIATPASPFREVVLPTELLIRGTTAPPFSDGDRPSETVQAGVAAE